MRPADFFAALKRRHVYRVAVIYAAVAWVLLQVADIVMESFQEDPWLMQGLILLAAIGFPIALVAAWVMEPSPESGNDRIETAPDPGIAARTADKPSLLVLPFECFSDQSADRWAADALTEDLTTLISRIPGFTVIARNTAFTFRGRSVDVRDVGTELGVRYVLEGSLRRSPAGLRVTAQLVETEKGTHLWAERYDRSVEDFESLHDELCLAIVFKLGSELTRAEVNLCRRRPPSEWGAWELYQQAKGTLNFSGWSKKTFLDTAALLEKAIELDPEYAPAHAYLALVLALGHWAWMVPDRDLAYHTAIAEAKRAMTMAPDSSEVMGFAGCALSDLGHPDLGIPAIERAIELEPSNSQAFAALGAAKIVSGQLEEGIRDLSHAVAISPADPGLAPWATILSVGECFSGHVEAALQWADRARKVDPHYFGAFLALALAQFSSGRNREAQQSLAQAKRLNEDLSESAIAAVLGPRTWEAMQGAGLTLSAD